RSGRCPPLFSFSVVGIRRAPRGRPFFLLVAGRRRSRYAAAICACCSRAAASEGSALFSLICSVRFQVAPFIHGLARPLPLPPPLFGLEPVPERFSASKARPNFGSALNFATRSAMVELTVLPFFTT